MSENSLTEVVTYTSTSIISGGIGMFLRCRILGPVLSWVALSDLHLHPSYPEVALSDFLFPKIVLGFWFC